MFAGRPAPLAVAIALTAAGVAAPASAHTTVIATLGTSPLLGSNAGAAALRAHVNEKSGLFDDAGAVLGLTPAQRRELRFRITADHLTAVTVPRHLDAMTWASAGHVRVIHDVRIPAGTLGWETDLTDGNEVVAVFIPAVCGNLSVIRRAAPHVAAAHVMAPAPVAAAAAPPAAPVAAEVPPAVAPPAGPVDVAAVPAPPPAPRGVHLSPFAALLPVIFGVHPGASTSSNGSSPAVVTSVYTPPGTTVIPPGSGSVPSNTPNVTTVVPPPTVPGGSTAPPPPPPPPGVGSVPCGPNPCK